MNIKKAVLICAIAFFAFAQQGPIITGGFSRGSAPAVLILLNDSRLPDGQLGDVANALEGKVLGVRIATRLHGLSFCNPDEWCLSINDELIGSSPDIVAGAIIGNKVTAEILKQALVTRPSIR